jgi:hypothetical protein
LIYGSRLYSSGPVKNMHIYFGSGSNSTGWIPSFWAHIWLVLVQFLKWPLMQLLFKKSSCWMSEWARLPYHSMYYTTILWACMIWCEPACMASPLMMHRLEFVSKNTRTCLKKTLEQNIFNWTTYLEYTLKPIAGESQFGCSWVLVC